MHKKILLDTCAWIDFLRSTEGAMGDFVALAIERDEAVLCGVVITELLQGAKGKKELHQLDFLFSNIETLPIEDFTWTEAGRMLKKLRNKGVTLPLTDALIATVANKHGVPLLTIDKHFQHLPIELVSLPMV